ncbi:MAG: oligopeptide/dipeptide ABC transporter, ATP-binding protein, C-terminal domain protein, partial [halophilic archaeon J07HB67]
RRRRLRVDWNVRSTSRCCHSEPFLRQLFGWLAIYAG